jgi:hypothetical protein
VRLLTIRGWHLTLEVRTLATFLLVAYLPSVLYLGHIDLRLPVPVWNVELALPLLSTGGDEHAGSTAGHGDHCHGTSDCTSSPQAPGASVQYLREEVVTVVAGGFLHAVPLDERRPGPDWDQAPPPPPPRPLTAS